MRFQRDWRKFPAVVQVDTPATIFAVGDAHADYDRLATLLAGAKIITGVPAHPEEVRWAAGPAILVVTGDFIDKWNQALSVIKLLRALQSSAAQAGGQVVILAGNHEIEFLAKPGAKKAIEFAAELKRNDLSPSDVAACRGDLGEFLCTLPFAARVNDWFFSHAGNTEGRSLVRLNADLETAVEKDGFASSELLGDNSILEARLGDSPWFRPHQAGAKKTLLAFAEALGVAHIVQGHQHGQVSINGGVERHAGELFQRFGLIFLIDTGMSRGVDDSRGAVLMIPSGGQRRALAVCADGSSGRIWDDGANSDAGKMQPCGAHQRLRGMI